LIRRRTGALLEITILMESRKHPPIAGNSKEIAAAWRAAGRVSAGFLWRLLLAGLLGYAALALFALVFANPLLFPAPRAGYRDSPEIRKFVYNSAGDAVALRFLPNPGSRWLVFYHHGNGEDLAGIRPRLEGLQRAGYAVLAWDYPGYGISDGRPSEALVLAIAEQLWEAIPEFWGYPHENVILYGRSLGAGPATWLASRHAAAGLVLEAAFTSVFRVPFPFNPLPWDIFDNLSRIGSVGCPVLVLHGARDEVVPFRHGRRLHAAASEPKLFAWFDGGRHNDLVEAYPEVYYSIFRRFTRLLGER